VLAAQHVLLLTLKGQTEAIRGQTEALNELAASISDLADSLDDYTVSDRDGGGDRPAPVYDLEGKPIPRR
jgi:hypothetical protein